MTGRGSRTIGGRLSAWPLKRTCASVRVLVDEMYAMAGGGLPGMRTDRRRVLCHLRQIAMYVCHTGLSIPQTHVGRAYGRDRTTVAHACRLTEERRDDRAYDEFVAAVERVVAAVFSREEDGSDELA